jgi:hypothetical protein
MLKPDIGFPSFAFHGSRVLPKVSPQNEKEKEGKSMKAE